MPPKKKAKKKTITKKVIEPLINYAYESESKLVEALKTGVTSELSTIELIKLEIIKERRSKK